MKRPWNRPSYPVWSLATLDNDGQANMNICTYVTAVSMKPKQFCIAVYHGTKTYENVKNGSPLVLQLLSEDHADVVRLLGKNSGFDRDKMPSLHKNTSPILLMTVRLFLVVQKIILEDGKKKNVGK